MKRICLIVMLLALFLTGCAKSEPATVATISPGPVSVTVSTVDELLAAIASDTEIILEPGYYDLSTASDYSDKCSQKCTQHVQKDNCTKSISGICAALCLRKRADN